MHGIYIYIPPLEMYSTIGLDQLLLLLDGKLLPIVEEGGIDGSSGALE